MVHHLIKNQHINGDPFLLEGGPTGILLVHGFKATPAEMRPLAEKLYRKGYTISAPLLPGHNTNPRDANEYTWQDWVESIETSYKDLQRRCEQVFIGGESTGGLICLYMASYHPEISGVLTYAPALEIILSLSNRIKLYVAAPFIPYIKESEPRCPGSDLPWRGYSVNPLKGLIQLLRLQRETSQRLQMIRRPVLIVQGCLDNRIPVTVPRKIYSSVQSTLKEIHWMEKSSHCVVLDVELDEVQEITNLFVEKALAI